MERAVLRRTVLRALIVSEVKGVRSQCSGFEESFKEFECLEERKISSFSKLVSSETRLSVAS